MDMSTTCTIHCQLSYHPCQVTNPPLSSIDLALLLLSDFFTLCAHMVLVGQSTANLVFLNVEHNIRDVMLWSFYIQCAGSILASLRKQQMFVAVAIKGFMLLVLLAQRSNRCTTRGIKTWHMYVSCPCLHDLFDLIDG
jgi:hypothetical protein